MKKKIFGGIAVVAIVVAMAFNVNLNIRKSSNSSSLALANVEALASGESSVIPCEGAGSGCYNGLWYPYRKEN